MSKNLVLAVVLGMLSVSSHGQAEDPGSTLRRAVEFHQKGSLAEAIREYEAFLRLYPEMSDVRSNLGAAYAAYGDVKNAIHQYEMALKAGNSSDPTTVQLNLGLAYYKAALFRPAAESFEKVLAARPGQKNAALLLADIALRSGQWKEVIEILSPFEKTDGDDQAVIYLLGSALIRDGQVDRGALLTDKILGKGDSAEAHLLLGSALLMGQDTPAAAEEFRKAPW